jgi:large subunit ribosomal protein L35
MSKPKLKTNSGAKKRLKVTGGGKYLRKSTDKRHLLTKKSSKRKRQLRGSVLVHKGDTYSAKRLLNQ